MGLNDLVPDDAGKAKGGRPSEGDGDTEKVPEYWFKPWEHEEEYWQEVWDENVEGEDPTIEEIAAMVDYSCVFPWDVKMFLEKYGIYEFDWGHMPDDYPPDTDLANRLRSEGIINGFTKEHPPAKFGRKGGNVNEDGSGIGEQTSGLLGLIEDAKD